MIKISAFIRIIGLFSILSLVACGGSGNTADSPLAPSVTLAVGLKQLQLSWSAVSGATSYRILENPDGASGFMQVGSDLSASQTSFNLDIAVHLQDWANAQYQVEACNSGGCTSSNTVDAVGRDLSAIGYFKASNTETGDSFLFSQISGDGNTLVVGAFAEDSAATGINGNQSDNSALESGAVYVFVRDNAGNWSQQAYIKASNSESGDIFGVWLSLSNDGNTLVVSSESESSSATGIDGNQSDNSALESGAAYVFVRDDAGNWSQQAYIKASNAEINDEFKVIALSGDGNTLAVGATDESSSATGINGDQNNNAAPGSGAVYVFTRSGSNWSQQAYIKASNSESDDNFGKALSLSNDGNTLVVASDESSAATGINGDQNNNMAPGSGAVYVFTRSGSTWSQQAYIKASNTGEGDDFGDDLDLSGDGNTLAVGADREDSSAAGINGDQSNNLMTDSGAVYVYIRSGSTWSQQAYIKASNTGTDDRFSIPSLSDDGNILAVGSIEEGSSATGFNGDQTDNSAAESGAVYLFTRTGDTWSQQAYIKAPNSEAGDFFVFPTLSSDGSTLAIGSFEDSVATGIGGDQTDNSADRAGAVFLY